MWSQTVYFRHHQGIEWKLPSPGNVVSNSLPRAITRGGVWGRGGGGVQLAWRGGPPPLQVYTASPPAIGSYAGYIPPPLLRSVLTPGIYRLPSCDWFLRRVPLIYRYSAARAQTAVVTRHPHLARMFAALTLIMKDSPEPHAMINAHR
eukprot:1175793-Prorocentrum_minimum.AAC.7